MAFVRWFNELGVADRGLVGGKSASLGELMRAGARVPAGFAVTVEAYDRFLDEHSHMPAAVEAELGLAYAQLGEPPVAVRSSSADEDGATASFAGQQETYVWIQGAAEVARHVERCWASLYTPQAIAYRAHLGGSQAQPRMGVAVQAMVDARVAGVLLTLSPISGDRSIIAINASWGLGMGVVGGEVTPDEYWVNKVTLEIVKRHIAHKTIETVPDARRAGVVTHPVADELQHLACLTDQEVLELARVAKAVERHYGCPQDIEWALARNQALPASVQLLQSRAETIFSQRSAAQVVEPKSSTTDYVLAALLGRRP